MTRKSLSAITLKYDFQCLGKCFTCARKGILSYTIKKACSLQLITYSFLFFLLLTVSFAQEPELEFSVDVTASTVPLPKIFRPCIDISGRGLYPQASWPESLAAPEVLDIWQKEIGFSGIYRLQYNLWEIGQLAKIKAAQANLLNNYEGVIKKISDAGGIVILNIFGTPAGMGKILDKKSPPRDLKEFKALIKSRIRNLSCNKRYNIWYEIWSAPDLDDFFLGRKQEYLNIYRMAGEAIKELEAEYKIHIPLGGPSVSWWFQDIDGNTIITPERSFIYDLIKFCYRYKLPLDFIAWHAYSTDPKAEKELTEYKKNSLALIRDWLSYFNFDKNLPLVVDEWNFDQGANYSPARKENSNIAASYLPSRMKNMYESGLNYQIYFSLEDFQNNRENVVRNVGIFWYDPHSPDYKGGPKAVYNVFRMLSLLEGNMFSAASKPQNNEFVDMLATKGQERIAILLYNYIDPDIATNYISRNIVTINSAGRKILLRLIKNNQLKKILRKELDLKRLRLTKQVKALMNKAIELNAVAEKCKSEARNVKISFKNLKGDYLFERYAVDSSCGAGCAFEPVEQKEVNAQGAYQEALTMQPYSVQMIVLKNKPPAPAPEPPPSATAGNQTQADNPLPAVAEQEVEKASP